MHINRYMAAAKINTNVYRKKKNFYHNTFRVQKKKKPLASGVRHVNRSLFAVQIFSFRTHSSSTHPAGAPRPPSRCRQTVRSETTISFPAWTTARGSPVRGTSRPPDPVERFTRFPPHARAIDTAVTSRRTR